MCQLDDKKHTLLFEVIVIASPGHIFLIVKEIIEAVTARCVNGLRFLQTTVLRLWHGSVQRDQTTCFQRDVQEMTLQVKWFVLVDAGCVQDTGPHRPSDTWYVSRALLDCGGLTLTEHTHADIAQGHLFCVVSKQYCGFWEGVDVDSAVYHNDLIHQDHTRRYSDV